MSGVLREAAALMRERAEAAAPGRWVHLFERDYDEVGPLGGHPTRRWSTPEAASEDVWFEADNNRDAAHIASWHPAVALAVADWLDMEADEVFEYINDIGASAEQVERAYLEPLTVARAYLGTPGAR